MLIRGGSCYNIYYNNWKTNPPDNRIIFVLYTPGVGKVHCLQLSAKQLSLFNRMKLINIISRLSKVPAAQKWNGKILFNIFKKYAPDALRQCYRTLWTQYIARYSLINYGLNDPNTFLTEEKAYQDKNLYQQAKFNAINQLLKMYTNKEYKPNETMFAKPIHNKPIANTKPNTIDPNKPIINPGVVPPKPGQAPTNKPGTTNPENNNQPTKPGTPPGDDDIIY